MRWLVSRFRAMLPLASSRLLEENNAQEARDCDLRSGEIRAWREPDTVQSVNAGTGTIYRWTWEGEDYWLTFQGDVDVARGPLADDEYGRVYWTGDELHGEPRMSHADAIIGSGDVHPDVSYKMGVPKPESTVAVSAQSEESHGIIDSFSAFGFDDFPGIDIRQGEIRVYTEDNATDHFREGQYVYISGIQDLDYEEYDPTRGYAPPESIGWPFGEDADLSDVRVKYQGDIYQANQPTGTAITPDSSYPFNRDHWDRIFKIGEFLNENGPYRIKEVRKNEFSPEPECIVLDDQDLSDVDPLSEISTGGAEVTHDFSEETAEGEYVTYVQTYVTDLGEEGPPSDASFEVFMANGQKMTLILPDITDDELEERLIEKRRLYRSVTGAQGATYQFLDEVDKDANEYEDLKEGRELEEVVPSLDWFPPPEDLKCLRNSPHGFLVGFRANEVLFSEPYMPHAWPDRYRYSFEYDVVAAEPMDQGVVVVTNGRPYLLDGIDPLSMTKRRIEDNAACLSRRSVVGLGYSVVYASTYGLVMVDRQGAQLITEGVLDEDDWAEFHPSSIHAYEYRGQYFAFYDGGVGNRGAFLFDPRRPHEGITTLDIYADSAHRDARDPKLYLLRDEQIQKWDADDSERRPFRWRSREFVARSPVNPGVAKVAAESYENLTFRYISDGQVIYEKDLTDPEPFRLPAGKLVRDLTFEVEGTDSVYAIEVAEDAGELEP